MPLVKNENDIKVVGRFLQKLKGVSRSKSKAELDLSSPGRRKEVEVSSGSEKKQRTLVKTRLSPFFSRSPPSNDKRSPPKDFQSPSIGLDHVTRQSSENTRSVMTPQNALSPDDVYRAASCVELRADSDPNSPNSPISNSTETQSPDVVVLAKFGGTDNRERVMQVSSEKMEILQERSGSGSGSKGRKEKRLSKKRTSSFANETVGGLQKRVSQELALDSECSSKPNVPAFFQRGDQEPSTAVFIQMEQDPSLGRRKGKGEHPEKSENGKDGPLYSSSGIPGPSQPVTVGMKMEIDKYGLRRYRSDDSAQIQQEIQKFTSPSASLPSTSNGQIGYVLNLLRIFEESERRFLSSLNQLFLV